MVGREHELAVASEFLNAVPSGAAALVIDGDAGIGKSTIWQAMVRMAKAADVHVLRARPAEAETKLALSAVADLFDDVPAAVFDDLPRPQRVALEVALLRTDPGSATQRRRTLAAAVRTTLAELSARQSVLIAIDDVHWLDTASSVVLGYAMRRLAGRPLRWVLTRRTDLPSTLTADDHMSGGSITRLHVAPLGTDALRRLLCDRFDNALVRPALVRIAEASGGNPLHALEIGRELALNGWPTSLPELPVPADLRALVAARLRRLPPRTRGELLAASALAAPDTSIIDEDALGPAEEAELVRIDARGRITFAHPLVASAVYGSASTARRRKLHAELAPRMTDAEQRARHLALAAAKPDERIARLLVEGAALARKRGSWEAAAELFERARDLTPSGQAHAAAERAIAAAEHHAHAGDRRRARDLLEETLDLPIDGPLRGDALRVLAEISYHDENFVEARRLFTTALANADAPRSIAAIELGISYTYSNTWEHTAAARHAARALAVAEETDDPALIAHAIAHTVMYDFLCGRGVDWDTLDRAVQLEDADAVVVLEGRPSVIAALLHLYVGHHDLARDQLRDIATGAADRGDESDLAFIVLWQSWLETRSGDFDAADDLAERGLAVAALTGSRSTHTWLLAQRALVRAYLGDVDGTRRDCAEVTALTPRSGHTLTDIWVAASLALLELSLGDARSAWRACAQPTAYVEEHSPREPVPAFFLPDALEALIALRKLDRAEALLVALEERALALDRGWALAVAARCRALLQAAYGDLVGARAAIEQALTAHDRIDMPFERARTQLVAGVIERRSRQRGRARSCLESALATFERLGTPLWVDRARDELSRVGARRVSGSELTATEQRVARLAAAGMTNREVAAELFISPKTVEANLARVYRKLGIASRAELGARMGGASQT